MQVRLQNRPLGRNVAATEIVSRVSDGNHWMWALTADDVNERLMPARQFEGVPREELLAAYYEAMSEVGIVGAGNDR